MLMREQENTIRIAVVEEQIRGMREQQKSHNAMTQRRLDEIEQKMDALIAVMHRGRGAYAASLMMAGLIAGLVTKFGAGIAQFWGR